MMRVALASCPSSPTMGTPCATRNTAVAPRLSGVRRKIPPCPSPHLSVLEPDKAQLPSAQAFFAFYAIRPCEVFCRRAAAIFKPSPHARTAPARPALFAAQTGGFCVRFCRF